MKYKFAAADMDGTLLNDSNEITPHTVKIIRQAVDKGLIFPSVQAVPFRAYPATRSSLAFRGL